MRDFDEQELSGQLNGDTQFCPAAHARAIWWPKPNATTPAQTNPAETPGDQAEGMAKPNTHPPDPDNSVEQGHRTGADHSSVAKPADTSEAVHPCHEAHVRLDRFADPLIAEIVETWRQRQDMVRAQQKLTLQAKSICRRFTAGDKTEADKLYQAVTKGKPHDLANAASVAVMPLISAQKPLVDTRDAYEKQLAKLGKRLPIAHMADQIKGVSYGTLATIVGEVGDMSCYERGVAGIWKRAGLAVIEGERQRKKAGDAALIHGYSPERHAVFWNVGCALLKSQGKIAEDGTDNRGPYRVVYDERKAYERPRVDSDGHAHNRACRYMTKRLLKHLWQAWRDAA